MNALDDLLKRAAKAMQEAKRIAFSDDSSMAATLEARLYLGQANALYALHTRLTEEAGAEA